MSSEVFAMAAAAAAAALAVGSRRSVLARLTRTPEAALAGRPASIVDLRRLPRRLAGPVAAGVGLLTSGPTTAVLAGVGAVVAVRALDRHRSRRVADGHRQAVVEVAAVLAGQLRAGQPPAPALAAAAEEGGELSGPLSDVAAVASLGGDAVPGLTRLADRPGADGLRAVACCWQVAVGTGAGLADALDATSLALERRQQDRRELDARLAGSRASATVLVLLPVFGVAMAQALGAGAIHLLLHTALGGVLLAAGAGLDAAGWWWTAHIVDRAVAP